MIKSGRNSEKKIFLLIILIVLLSVKKVEASGGEEMEGSALEKYLLQNGIGETKELFEDFEEMDYALFLETNVGYGVTGNYYKYGIYGDFTQTREEGRENYFNLCEKILDAKLSMETHKEWAENEEEYIYDVSPDLCWVISREYNSPRFYEHYTDKVIYNGNIVLEVKNTDYKVDRVLKFKKDNVGGYELEDQKSLEIVEQLVHEIWEGVYKWTLVKEACIDDYGRIVAISEVNNSSIELYNMDDGELIRKIVIPDVDSDYSLEISQFVGTEEGGWLVFSNGSKTYRLNYPEGTLEQLGEFMFDTTFSPDGKYLAYCTGNIELYDKWMDWADDDEKLNKINSLYEEWNKIPAGWYIKEIETGNTTFIPIETWEQDHRPLYGGRCIWIEKDKLLQILNQ